MKKGLLKMLSLLLMGLMLITVVPITIFAESEDDMYITDLKVNNLAEPIGIDTVPTFRWINNMSGYARSQSAYQIIVASTAEKAAAHDGDVWDSGKVESNLNYDIVYGGDALSSRTEYFFAVQVWDENDNSVWSDISKFETGFLSDSEWTAKWIGGQSNESRTVDIDLSGASWIWQRNGAALNASANGAMYFRSTFNVDKSKNVDNILLGVTADNYSTVYINGTEVAKMGTAGEVWRTGATADITSVAKAGENCIAAYAFNVGKGYAGFIAKIVVMYTDGSKDTFVTDSTWKVSETVGNGWQDFGYNDSSWGKPDQSIVYGGSPWANKVTLDTEIIEKNYTNAPMLRKTFEVSKDVKKARAYVSGLGLFEMRINGTLPDDTVLNPAHTQYDKTVHYRVFDVTDLLVDGNNAIAVELGNFFYNCDVANWFWDTAPWRDNTKLLLELVIEYSDGTTETIVSDESWKMYANGPITYNNIYLGEHYDARLEVDNWTNADYDDSAWKNAELRNAPTGDLVFENMEPMRRIDTFTPTVLDKGNGTFIIENPVMTTGWAKIRFNAPAGTEITITYGEKMSGGDVVSPVYSSLNLQIDKYICSGDKDEIYEPKFTYKGYRYIKVENYPGTLLSSDVECYFIANDVDVISSFETGNETINTLHEIVRRTMWNNFQGKPTDTPVYEKNGWSGDFNVSLEMMNFNFDTANFSAKFLDDLGDRQTTSGVIPVIAPGNWNWNSSVEHNAVVWNSAYINGIYEGWRTNGLTSEIEEHYDSMRFLVLSYIKVLEGNGWVWTDNQLSDWVSPDGDSNSAEGSGIVGTGYAYLSLSRLAEMAEEIGKSADAAEYRVAMEKIYTAFNAKYYDAKKGYYDTGYWNETYAGTRSKYRQTSNLVPLAFGLCPDEYKDSVVNSLINDIVVNKETHLDTGMVGTKYILPTLSALGYGDTALAVVMQSTYPSWGYWIANGANSTWEAWRSARSHNHYFLGTYEDWFFKNLAGVSDMSNGYETVTLRPEVYSEVGYTDMTLDTVRGKLSSHWYYTDDFSLVWDITIPVGTTATVYLPYEALSVNGKALTAQEGITVNEDSLTVLSGEYSFAFDNIDFYRGELEKTIEQAEMIDASYYLDMHYNAFAEVLETSKAVFNDAGSNADAVLSANSELLHAMEVLANYSRGNLALGKTVSVSSDANNASWNKGKLTDGELYHTSKSGENQGWTSITYIQQDHTEWAMIDLGGMYKFNRVDIMPTGCMAKQPLCEGFPKDFEIQVSVDGTIWETVLSRNDYPTPTAVMQTFDFDAAYARYVRVYATSLNPRAVDSNYYRMQLAEIEVYLDTPEVTMDVDGDGDVDITDALKQLKLAVNGDASLLDVVRICKYIAA